MVVRKAWVAAALFAIGHSVASSPVGDATFPPGFVDEVVFTGVPQLSGLTVSSQGHVFFWEKAGRVSVVNASGVPAPGPLIDISEEVGNWADHGLHSFALDPDYETNGYVYLLYAVDYHHLVSFGTPAYNPATDQFGHDTISRITRYTVTNPFDPFARVDPASRKVLLGESLTTGIPICSNGHSIGTLAFGSDGTLLVTNGDSHQGFASGTCLSDGIITPLEDIGTFRSQFLDSHCGKLLRIDPASGDGVPSNPFYDALEPRAPRSRIWSLGLRSPFRFTRRPGTGSSDPADGDPGALYIGDVGHNTWEELHVADGPGLNFGWPVYEGLEPHTYYSTLTGGAAVHPTALNPLFGVGGCTQSHFLFKELITQDSQNPPFWPNPCDAGQQVPAGIPTFVHRRPVLAWRHPDLGPPETVVLPTYDDSGNATMTELGSPQSAVSGQPFFGNCSIAGAWYTGTTYPAEYQNSYFHADHAVGWIRVLRFDDRNQLLSIDDFGTDTRQPVALANDPVSGDLYWLQWKEGGAGGTSVIHRLRYGTDAAPTAQLGLDAQYGPEPLTVHFSAAGSADPEGAELAYAWDFGDGQPPSPVNGFREPVRVYPSEDVTGAGTVVTKLDGMIPPVPMGIGSTDKAVLQDGVYGAEGSFSPVEQYDTAHVDALGQPDKGGVDWIGYTFASPREFLGLTFQEGLNLFTFGGWFDDLHVQVRDATTGVWSDVTGLESNPAYPGDPARHFETFQLHFAPVAGDGIRLYGDPGGEFEFVSAGELRVHASPAAPVGAPQGYTVQLSVTDDVGLDDVDTIEVSINNTPPAVTMTSPTSGQTYAPGSGVLTPLTADVTDAEQPGALSCEWDVALVHDNHEHPEPPDASCGSQILLLPHGELSGSIIFWRMTLTVTDPLSLSTEVTHYMVPLGDCNGNGIDDALDIAGGFSLDQNGDGIPDECETDCDANNLPDVFELATGIGADLNLSGVLDPCEPVLTGPVPGLVGQTNDLLLSEGQPGSTQILLVGQQVGPVPVPGCPGLAAGILDWFILGFVQANGSGEASFQVFLPAGQHGVTAFLQTVDILNCEVSSLAIFEFP